MASGMQVPHVCKLLLAPRLKQQLILLLCRASDYYARSEARDRERRRERESERQQVERKPAAPVQVQGQSCPLCHCCVHGYFQYANVTGQYAVHTVVCQS